MAAPLNVSWDLVRAAPATMGAGARERMLAQIEAQMWALDTAYADKARWIDARICLTTPPTPYTRGCGGSPICTWGFYQLDVPCTEQVFGDMLFQANRYTWAQERLRSLLAAEPQWRTITDVAHWVDWCTAIMRYVSVARYATNISSHWYVPGSRSATVLAGLHLTAPTREYPAGLHMEPSTFRLPSLWTPRDLNVIDDMTPQRHPIIPRGITSFDPVPQAGGGVLSGHSAMGVLDAAWPRNLYGPRPGAVRDQMLVWFARTLGRGQWIESPRERIRYSTTIDCPYTGGPVVSCVKEMTGSIFYGGADATIELCRAWARDITERSFGDVVSAGLTGWLDAYAALPENLRILTLEQIGSLRDAAQASSLEATMAQWSAFGGVVGAVAGAVNAAAGVIVAVFVALAALLVQLLYALGAAAYGGGELESACLVSPVVRTIPTGEGSAACDFDIRGAGVSDAVLRFDAIRNTAALNLPVRDWFRASEAAGTSNITDLIADAPASMPVWPWVVGAAAVVTGGLVVWKLKS